MWWTDGLPVRVHYVGGQLVLDADYPGATEYERVAAALLEAEAQADHEATAGLAAGAVNSRLMARVLQERRWTTTRTREGREKRKQLDAAYEYLARGPDSVDDAAPLTSYSVVRGRYVRSPHHDGFERAPSLHPILAPLRAAVEAELVAELNANRELADDLRHDRAERRADERDPAHADVRVLAGRLKRYVSKHRPELGTGTPAWRNQHKDDSPTT